MSRRSSSATVLCLVLIALLPTLLHPQPARGAETTREFTLKTSSLYVGNLIGAVDVRPGTGDAFRVAVRLQGDEEAIAMIDLQQESNALRIVFPLDRHLKYVYPELGSGFRVSTGIRAETREEKSWLRRTFGHFKERQLTVRGSGEGLEVWADVVIEVPSGRALTLRHGVGAITAGSLQADVDLESSYGPITVESLEGELRADTGSGEVRLSRVDGDIDVDTGSGDVDLRDCKGGRVKLDTGSGEVMVAALECRSLAIDTGSGNVRATGVAVEQADIDTGSGDVTLGLDRMGSGRFKVDTGSGGVELELPPDASADIVADTGSGDIQADVPGAELEKLDGGRRRLVVGDGAADVLLDTGSGSITVRSR
ncbi:MAG: DUF4097 family beta strand repeat protein [bacterium]|nr:DUF4097 family beta strand repeat protein [bacterium]